MVQVMSCKIQENKDFRRNRNLTRPSISESAVKTEGQPLSCGKIN